MSESNKILDVSYGTFSCRLEGFDDSVGTLKSVVDYFHQLHGVALWTEETPVMPDPDAVARLANAGTDGEVVVEQDENGISLRVLADGLGSPLVVAEDDDTDEETDAAPHEESAAPERHDAAQADAEMPEPAPIAEDDAFDDDDDDDVAEPAQSVVEPIRAVPNALSARIAALTAAQRGEDIPQANTAADEPVTTQTDAPAAETTPAGETADMAEPDEVTPQHEIDDLRALDGAQETDHDTSEPATMPDADDAPVSSDDSDTVADKLQRIRAITNRGAQAGDGNDTDDDFAEDIPEDDDVVAPKPGNPLAQRLAELAKRNSELMDANDLQEPPTETPAAPLMLEPEERVEDQAEETSGKSAPLLLTPEGAVNQAGSDETADLDDGPSDEVPAEAKGEDTPSRKPELLILTERTDPIAEEPDVEAEYEPHADDDFDLHEEVAKIEQELASRPGNEVARHGLPRSVEDAMSRILDRTDLQLDMEETRDGRAAFAQLKAAVAATEAARQLGDNGAMSRDVSEMYRDDLGALEAGEGKSRGRAAPLRLVPDGNDPSKSTLREVAPLNEAASRLRNIAEQSMARAESSREKTFVDFVKDHAPSDLAEELEAAAAYLTFVAGERDLSRPQLIRLVQTAHKDEITREDGLRSFARLLRQGRVIKLPNGRFSISDSTRFRPSGGQAANG